MLSLHLGNGIYFILDGFHTSTANILAQKKHEMPLHLENLNIFNDASTTGFYQAHLLM